MPHYLPDCEGNNRNATWSQSPKTSNVGGGFLSVSQTGQLSQKTFHLTAEDPEPTPSGPAWSKLGRAECQLQAPCSPMSQNSLYLNRSILWSDQVRNVRLGETATQLQNKERSLMKRHIRPRRAKTLVFVTDMKTAEGRRHRARDADPLKSACCRCL